MAMWNLSTGYSCWALESHRSSLSTVCRVAGKRSSALQQSVQSAVFWGAVSAWQRDFSSLTCCPQYHGRAGSNLKVSPRGQSNHYCQQSLIIQLFILYRAELFWSLFSGHPVYPVHSEPLYTDGKCISKTAEAPSRYVTSFQTFKEVDEQ